jgi:heat shock protein HslJ
VQRFLIVVPVAALLLVPACGSDEPAGHTLEGTMWNLTSVPSVEIPSDTVPNATFQDGTVSGNSGCNTYHGSYETAGQELTFGPLASTMMACETPQMDLETAFLAALGSTASYAIEGDELILSDADGVELARFQPGAEG